MTKSVLVRDTEATPQQSFVEGAPVKVIRTAFAFDDAGIGPSAFAITAVDSLSETGTLTIAGSHAAVFPAGAAVIISGSTGNDGTYTSTGATFGAGSTTIPLAEGLFDPTVDGSVYDNTSGILCYTPSEAGETIVNAWFSVPESTQFDGTAIFHFQAQGDPLDQNFGGGFSAGSNSSSNRTAQITDLILTAAKPVDLLTTAPMRLMISGVQNSDPSDAMQGAGEIVLLVAPA